MSQTTFSAAASGNRERETAIITVGAHDTGRVVSPTLFGLFLEDINFGCDGGLTANMVNNHSFEGIYVDRGDVASGFSITPAGRLVDRNRHWSIDDGSMTVSGDSAVAEGAHYARITSHGRATIRNLGYPGGRPAMPFRQGVPLLFTALVRTDQFDGQIEIRAVAADGSAAATTSVDLKQDGWQTARTQVTPSTTSLGYLEIVLHGTGSVDLDEVSLLPANHWGANDPRWSQGLLRSDLVEALRDLNPTFLRFPGGCIVEGGGQGTEYKWKNTIGPLVMRKPELNLWGQLRAEGDYSQSFQIGFYEYFLLCEDLGIEPMPIVWAGISCQFRADECVPLDSPEFEAVVQDTIDLIDWATADPAANKWAAMRAAAGHPEPFPLNYIGIGNENFGAEYLSRFDRIKSAVEAHRPGIQAIISTGANPEGPDFDEVWAHAKPHADIIVDEHFYRSPDWFIESATRYDDYSRGGARVFLGEYAAHEPALVIPDGQDAAAPGNAPTPLDSPTPNTWASALAEAVFLTGVERNADVIAMTCYAPLFNLVDHGQWAHNLININPLHFAPTPNYLVQQLFGRRLGTTVASLDGDLPADVYASATQDGRQTHIKMVNVGADTISISIKIAGALDGLADIVQLSGTLDAINQLPFDGTPDMRVLPEEFHLPVTNGVLQLQLQPRTVLSVSATLR